MYKDFENAYSECSNILRQFGRSTEEYRFKALDEAVEIYFLMSIKVAMNNSKAISVLLQNNLPLETNHIVRNIMETFFKLNWVVKDKSHQARLDRVNQLEATPFNKYEKELNYIKKHLDKPYAPFTLEDWEKRKAEFEEEKNSQPQLLRRAKGGGNEYKIAPSFADIMGEAFRVKYYHLYCFISAYVHPSPFLKIFLLDFDQYTQTPTQVAYEPTKQSLTFGLMFLELILGYSISIFQPYNSNKNVDRIELYNKISEIAKKYYGGFKDGPVNPQ
jgi:Family of unknown function (DUF5677)